jgi:DNA-directed RNA polymerase subunit omega
MSGNPHDLEFRGKIEEQFLASLAKNEAHQLSAIKIVHPGFTGGETMKLIDGFDSNYRYILVAARRARQLQSGAPPVVQTNSRKPCRIAQDEIRAGKVKWEIPETRSAAEQAAEMLDKAFGQDA